MVKIYLREECLYLEGYFSPSGLLIGRALDRVGVGLPGAAARLLLVS
jgi:hypothetical protein